MKEGARYESSEPAAAPGPAWAAAHPSGLAPSPQRPLVSSLSSRQPGQVPGGGHGQGIWAGPEPGSGGLRRSQQLSAPNGGPWENQTSGLPHCPPRLAGPRRTHGSPRNEPKPLPVGWTSTGQHPGSGAGFSHRQLSDLGKTLGPGLSPASPTQCSWCPRLSYRTCGQRRCSLSVKNAQENKPMRRFITIISRAPVSGKGPRGASNPE